MNGVGQQSVEKVPGLLLRYTSGGLARITDAALPVDLHAVPLGCDPRDASGTPSHLPERPALAARPRPGQGGDQGGGKGRRADDDAAGPAVSGDRAAALCPAPRQRPAAPGNVQEASSVAACAGVYGPSS